jgi:hypothetical protein
VADLLKGFRSAFQRVENFAVHSRADDERRRVSEAKLHQPLGTDWCFLSSFLAHDSSLFLAAGYDHRIISSSF